MTALSQRKAPGKLGGHAVLLDEGVGTEGTQLVRLGLEARHGQDDDPGVGHRLSQAGKGVGTVEHRHVEIEHDHLGLQRAGQGECLGAVGCLAD